MKYGLILCILISVGIKLGAAMETDKDALTYCNTHPETFMVLLWPTAEKKGFIKTIEQKLFKKFNVIYKKEITLKNDGPLMFLRHVYETDVSRVGTWKDGFKHARHKMRESFVEGHQLHAYLVEVKNVHQIRDFKLRVRDHVHANPIHAVDNHDEAVSLAQIVFSDSTLNFLNSCKLVKQKRFERLFKDYTKGLQEDHVSPLKFCVVGDAVLAAYGIKDCDKIEVIDTTTTKKRDKVPYFYYFNHKFAALDSKHISRQIRE